VTGAAVELHALHDHDFRFGDLAFFNRDDPLEAPTSFMASRASDQFRILLEAMVAIP